MPTFIITDPSGKEFEIDAPEGATEQQALDYAKQQFSQAQATAAPERGFVANTISNIPSSAANFAKGIYESVRHPVDTINGVRDLGIGAISNLLPSSMRLEENRPKREMASAVGDFYKDRYGSLSGLSNTVQTDPVGLLSDASGLLSGGGALATKVPGLLSVGKALKTAGDVTNPINVAGKAASVGSGLLGNGAAALIGDVGTHTGSESIKMAYRAGRDGGDRGSAFVENMRGNAPIEDVLTQAKGALDQMRRDRGEAYRSGMADVSKDQTVLNFNPIEKAFSDQRNVGVYKGKVLDESTGGTRDKIDALIKDWRASDPAEFHTPEGFDALKKAIGDVRDSTEFGSPSRKVADGVYNAVKTEITKQAPSYAGVMKDYETASELVKEIERGLSLGKKASVDTAIRKLQSLTRNNVQTNYGNRLNMAKQLEAAGANTLLPSLAGQALNTLTPRGLGNAVTLPMTGGLSFMAGGPAAMLPVLAAQSPRLMGEASYLTGKLAGGVNKGSNLVRPLAPMLDAQTLNALYQAQQHGLLNPDDPSSSGLLGSR